MNKSGYWSPYLAGAGIGLALLASFVIAGQGLGASRAFTVGAGTAMREVLPGYTATLTYLEKYLETSPFRDWTVLEVAGVFLGAFLGVALSRSFKLRFDRAATMTVGMRAMTAFGGGALLGFASRLARGCTSGVALTGGSQFALSGWVFVIAMFASGFLFASLFRRLWS
ncbi:MAG TPA: YeeE/YedE thiosulfate transporter family protein [Nitrospirota bacterium]|nr:YeeE/YedE thiosulfate transporter family protein [Nitrospirota bacterium]